MMDHLNSFSASRGENLNKKVSKNSNAREVAQGDVSISLVHSENN